METGSLSTWESWAAIIGGPALLLIVWPQLRMWATRRMVFYLMTPLMLHPSYMKLRRKLPSWCWTLQRRLVPLHYRESRTELVALVENELIAMASTDAPSPDINTDTKKMAAYLRYKRRRLQRHLERRRRR